MGKRWSEDEDNYFVESVSEFVMERGQTLAEALLDISEYTNRTYGGCQMHWINSIKPHLEGSELLEKISKNTQGVKVEFPNQPYRELYKAIFKE